MHNRADGDLQVDLPRSCQCSGVEEIVEVLPAVAAVGGGVGVHILAWFAGPVRVAVPRPTRADLRFNPVGQCTTRRCASQGDVVTDHQWGARPGHRGEDVAHRAR